MHNTYGPVWLFSIMKTHFFLSSGHNNLQYENSIKKVFKQDDDDDNNDAAAIQRVEMMARHPYT